MRWKYLGAAEKLVGFLILITIISEVIALAFKKLFGNNLPVYHFFSPIELFVISLYFYKSLHLSAVRRLAIIIGILGFPLALLNALLLQPLHTINSYFLLFEGTAIIFYSLCSLYVFFIRDDLHPLKHAHFWIAGSLLIYWVFTFSGWAVYSFLESHEFTLNPIFDFVLTTSNYIFYGSLVCIFLFYKSLVPSGEST
jgi:hypothetical protein